MTEEQIKELQEERSLLLSLKQVTHERLWEIDSILRRERKNKIDRSAQRHVEHVQSHDLFCSPWS